MDPEAILRAAFEAYARRDVDDLMEFLSEDVEIIPAIGAVIEGRVFVGREGVEDFFESLDTMWRDFEMDLGEVRADGDRVLTLGRVHARGAGSGVVFDEEIASVTSFRAGKITRWETFLGYERALTLFRERA